MRILCVSNNRARLITLPVSRTESINLLKDRIKRVLIRYNLIEKESMLNCKHPKLIHIKNIYNPELLSRHIYSAAGQIIDYPCVELNDLSTIEEADILPK